MCVCVCACVRACVRACLCVCVFEQTSRVYCSPLPKAITMLINMSRSF